MINRQISSIEYQTFSKKITIIQYVCSIIVIILHSNNLKGYNYVIEDTFISKFVYSFEKIISCLGHLAVPTFFVISGFLFFKGFNTNQYFIKIKKRLKSLLIPYLVWNTLGLIFFAILTYAPLIKDKMNQAPVSLQPLDIIISIINAEYTSLWYVQYLIIFFIFSPILFYILKSKIIGEIVILILIVLYYINEFSYYSLLTWAPIFMIGAYLGIHFSELIINNCNFKEYLPNKKRIFTFVVVTLFILSWVLGFITSEDKRVMYTLRLVSPFFVWCSFDFIFSNLKIKWWMKISFFLYCSHFFIISIFQKIMLILFGNGPEWTLIVYLITPIIVILILNIMAYVLKRYFPKFWSLLSGGR